MGSKSKGSLKKWDSKSICLSCKKEATLRYRPLGDIPLCPEDYEKIESERRKLIEKAIKDDHKNAPVNG